MTGPGCAVVESEQAAKVAPIKQETTERTTNDHMASEVLSC
jgi:hypothetical protein